MPPFATALGLAACLSGAIMASAGELTIATVNNGHMIEMQKLTPKFEAAHPGIALNWVTLEEGVLRQRVTTDTSTKDGSLIAALSRAPGRWSAGVTVLSEVGA